MARLYEVGPGRIPRDLKVAAHYLAIFLAERASWHTDVAAAVAEFEAGDEFKVGGCLAGCPMCGHVWEQW